MSVEQAGCEPLPHLLRPARRDLSRPRRMGTARRHRKACGAPAAGPPAGADRRQIDGRVCNLRDRQGTSAAHRTRSAAQPGRPAVRGARGLVGGPDRDVSDSHIAHVHGRRVWDSRGRPTVEAEVRLAGGAVGRAIAPAGASTGSGEAIELRDGGRRLGGRDVRHAVAAVNGEIAAALTGHDATDQAAIDRPLIALDGTPHKKRLGGNALVAVSMAALHAAANAVGRPLYAYLLGEQTEAVMPLPEIQIFGGGAHAGRRVDIQDFMIVAPRAQKFDQAAEWTGEESSAACELR